MTHENDLEYEISSELNKFYSRDPFESNPTTIMEYSIRLQNEVEIHQKQNIWIQYLQLYKTGSVYSLKFNPNPDSLLLFSGSSGGSRINIEKYKYEIAKNDEKNLISYFNKMSEVLPGGVENLPDEKKFISIAFSRYIEAVLKGGHNDESRLSFLMMALEAILLENEVGEFTEKLAQRTAIILSPFFNDGTIKIYNETKKAYYFRSKYLHGSLITKEEKEEVHKLLNKFLEYTRKILVISILLKYENKSKFISRINNSILDVKAREKLYADLQNSISF